MTTHIRMLRPYTYKGETKVADKTYKNLFCEDINYLFNEGLEKLLSFIPEEDKYNLYYTACTIETREMTRKDGKTYTNQRAFVDQEVIPFDIDHVCTEQIDSYLPIISQALGIPLNEMIIVYTGNGIQVICKSAVKITDLSFFKDHSESYKNLCKKLQASLNESGLAADVDTSVWSPGRLLRLPNTLNRKPLIAPLSDDAVIKHATLSQYTKISGAGLTLQKDTPLTKLEGDKYTKRDSQYQRPDADYIRTECLFIKGCLDGAIDVHEPECYAFLGLTAFLEDDDQTALEGLSLFSSPTIDKMDHQAKLEQARHATTGPRTCSDIMGRSDACNSCPHNGKITTPLQLRRPSFNIQLATSGELGNKPSELEVVAYTLTKMGIKFDPTKAKIEEAGCPILKEGKDLDVFKKDFYHWNGTHWDKLTEANLMEIESVIIQAYNFNATNAKMKATLRALLERIPYNTRESFYNHRVDKANFQNGTLHAIPNEDSGTFSTKFTPHAPDDRLTYILPGEYTENSTYDCTGEFGQMLERIFIGDTDKDQKIHALQQMFGACLLPIFPRVFFLVGIPGSGKSTILKILTSLIGNNNITHCELTGKSEFNLELMAGYNVNMVADIDETERIRINVIKQIEDRLPMRINRKFKSALIAPLPPINIFGCNDMPPLYEKSGALSRRTTIITFHNSFTTGEEYLKPEDRKSNKEIANVIFHKDYQNITAFALQGVIDLLTKGKGHYTNPESGIEKTLEWITEKDIVQQFLNAIKDDEVDGVAISKDDLIPRTELYEKFNTWWGEENGGIINVRNNVTRNQFYKTLRNKSYTFTRRSNDRFIKGFLFNGDTNQKM